MESGPSQSQTAIGLVGSPVSGSSLSGLFWQPSI